MIYYATYLNNELDFLKLQFELNYNYVDKYIISEASLTFSGKPKPLFFDLNRSLFEKYNDKIIYFNVDLSTFAPLKNFPPELFNPDDWARDRKQKTYFFDHIDFTADDIVINSDVDEFIFLDRCLDQIDCNDVTFFELDYRKFYMNLRCDKFHPCIHANAYSPLKYQEQIKNLWNLKYIRNENDSYKLIKNAGYHFSWCYNIKQNVENKINSFAHQECNTDSAIQQAKRDIEELPETRIIDDLPEHFYKNYGSYIYQNRIKLKVEQDKCAEFWINKNKTITELKCSILSGYKNNHWFGPHELLFRIDNDDKILDFGCGLGRNIDILKTNSNQVDGYDFPVMIDSMKPSVKSRYNELYTHNDWEALSSKKYDTIFSCLVLQHTSLDILESYLKSFVAMTDTLYLVSRWYIDENHMLIMPILEKYFTVKDVFIYSDQAKMLSFVKPPENECHFEAVLIRKNL